MTAIRRVIDLLLLAWLATILVVGLSIHLAPALGGRVLAIRTGSMEPAIPVGSLVVAIAADPARLVEGDVVAISLRAGTIVTHRVDAIVLQDDRRSFRTRGDANDLADPVLIVPDQLVGRIELVLPWLGYVLAMLVTPLGVVAVASIVASLWLAAWLLDEYHDRRPRPGLASQFGSGFERGSGGRSQ